MADSYEEWLKSLKIKEEPKEPDPLEQWKSELKVDQSIATIEEPDEKEGFDEWRESLKVEKKEPILPATSPWWENAWGALTKPREEIGDVRWEAFYRPDIAQPFALEITGEDIEKVSTAPEWQGIQQKVKSGSPLTEDETEFVDRYMEGHTIRPPGFTSEQWVAQPEVVQKGYNYLVLGSMIAGLTYPIWSHPSFTTSAKTAIKQLYGGKPPKFHKETIKGYTLGGKPETKIRFVPDKPAMGAASVTREAAMEFAGIRPAIHKTFPGLKSHIYKQLDEVVAKIKGARPTTTEMIPFRQLADEKLGPVGVLKGLLDPSSVENVYSQINKELSVMLVNFKPIIPEEERIAQEQITQPIPDEVKKEFEKFATEREGKEEYVREMLSMSEGETILSRIKRRGGIKWSSALMDYGTQLEIPLSVMNSKGLSFDEMADELGMSEDELWENLIAYKSRKQVMDEKVSEILKRTAPIEPEEKITPRVKGKPVEVPEIEISEEVKKTEIIKQMSEVLGVPIRLGHFRERALGIYKKKPKVIRLKSPIDVPTAAHEIGHYLNDKVFKFDLHGYTEELVPLDPSKKENLREGYAEFVSRYVIDRAKAETETPRFFNYFEETISSVPEVKEVLDTTKADYERWLSMPATAKVASQINYEPDKTGGFGFGKLYTMLIDELYPLKKYTDMARQQGLEVKTEEDPFILATLHRGWHGKADSFLRHKTFDANFKWSGEPLTAVLQPIVNKDALKDFDTYLVAKQARFRLEQKKKVGLDYRDVRKAAEELEEKHPEFKDSSQRLYDYQDRLLQYARDSGLIGQETYEKFSVNLSYVPLHRVIERLGARGVLGKGFANLPSVYKRFKGSEREIIPPTESIVKNTYVIIDAVERNRIAQAMTRLSKLHPELGRAVEKIPGDIARVAQLSEQEIANIVKEQGFELAPKDVEDLINVFRPSMFLPKGNIIKVVEAGKPAYYEVDPDIYRSLTMMDREQMNIMIRLLAYPARMLRIGAVSLSPEFLVRNPARDAFTAFVYSKAGFIPGLDTMRGLFSTVTRDETYWKWKISGAEHSMLTSLDREYLREDVKSLMGDRIAKVKNVVKHPIKSAQILAELGEEATRIGEFKLVMEGGKRWWMLAERIPETEPERAKILRAGRAARDVTLDFARLGTKTRAVNQIIAFWNANVQDLDKIRRSFGEHPIRTLWKILLGITIPSIALWVANKDDERVQELPQWQRDLFWIVPTKKRLWRIPKPFTLGIIFGSGAERILDYISEQDPESIKELGRNVLRGINPGVLPTAFLPAIEAATNYSFFLERPVVSEALKRKIPELQYSPYTTETAKLIGDTLNVSPQKVEYFLRGYTGGFGKLAMETSDAIMQSILDTEEPRRPKTLADVPLIRGFIAREPWGSSESISRFYTLYERAEMGIAAINQMVEEKRREKALEYRDKYPEYKYVEMLRKVAKELSELRKKRNEILESNIDVDRKLQAIENIEKRMTRIASSAVEVVK